jgi:DnaJ-class molecular chaperone
MSEKCDVCGGTGRVYTDLGFGVTVEPCPKCNKAYRRHMDELTKEPEEPRKKAAQ